ncbi:hypothetical protein ACFU8X_06895 [Brevibacillus porteri]|uniref:hypothetical protein n=1 Tax=Brevibacillus porteri TaxID=2126350 RepID=UPI00370CE447
MARRAFNNQVAEVKGKLDAFGDTLAGLWNTAVDAGDMLLTGLAGEENTQDIYEFVSGEEVGTLRERNGIVKGIEQGVNNTLNYVGDTFTGKKAPEEILSDLGKLGEGLYDEYLDPFAKDAQYDQDNLIKGGLWTRSEDESYAKGQNEFKKDMVVAEVAVTVLSAGTGTTVMRTVKTADKLDGPNGKKKSGDQEGNGKGVLLPNSSIDDAMSAMLKDGKLKTHGKSFAESMIKLKDKIEEFLKQMGKVFDGRVVVFRNAATGQLNVYWVRNSDLPGNGSGGGGNHRRSDPELDIERDIKNIIFGDNLQDIRKHAKKVTLFDDYCEIATHDGKVVRIDKQEMPDSSFTRLDELIHRKDDITKYGVQTYGAIRKLGLSDVEDVARNTGMDTEDIMALKKHLFLEKHEVPQSGGILVKYQHFNPDEEIAYVWSLAQKQKLTSEQSSWFKQLADHELAESKLMKGENKKKKKYPYLELSAWSDELEKYTGDPPGAHDMAPPPPKTLDDFIEFADKKKIYWDLM